MIAVLCARILPSSAPGQRRSEKNLALYVKPLSAPYSMHNTYTSTTPARATDIIHATDLERLRGYSGESVTIQGIVHSVVLNDKAGIVYINLHDDFWRAANLAVITASREKRQEIAGNAESLKGKVIRVHGKLTEYRGYLRMELKNLSSIKLLSGES